MRINILRVIAIISFYSGTVSACNSKAPDNLAFHPTDEKNFRELISDSMSIMDRDMEKLPESLKNDQRFLAAMIPHHQGAIDMSKALLLYSKNEKVRGLALQIIAAQKQEIQIMKTWLENEKAN